MRPLLAAEAAVTPATVPASARPLANGAVPWIVPRWSDPRFLFAALLTLYAVLGASFLGFNRSPVQMIAVVASACLLDLALARAFTRRWVVPLSAYITGCSVALLLNYSHGSPLLFLPVLLAIGSKYVFTYEGRHIFNPSLFGVATCLLLTRDMVTAAPAYQWAGGAVTFSAFVVAAALALFVARIGRTPLILSFLVFYALQTALRAWVLRHHLPAEVLFVGTVTSPAFFLFTFYMITDPATSPKTVRGQVAYAFALTVVDLYLHTRASVFTFFYAALACGAGRLLFLHGRRVWREGFRSIMASGSPAWLGRAGAVAGLGLLLAVGSGAARGIPHRPVSFRMERLGPGHTGIRTGMSDVLERVDPRVAHIAKWLLSVGDAAAVGDYDGDGRMDLFLTNPLKRLEDRGALYRNLGGMRFERVSLPALEEILARFPDTGLPAAAAFVDYDGDGDQDLSVGFGYGPTRLLRNQSVETGSPTFVDVTETAGLGDHTVCLAVVFFDFDRDGRLDQLVTNALGTHLPGYERPTPLNVFHLPPPAYEGDRRMLRFMHDGWHDADNGGPNLLYRGLAGGRFERLDAAQLGMPETHWTVAAASADLNRDGWTDLYLANDFGPDDVYLNRGGHRFERVHGRFFGEIGRDTYKGMNVTTADFDGNGWLDVYVSNNHHSLQAEGSLLWMIAPGREPFMPRFRDQATQRGALNENRWGWGAAAGDLDLDGWLDIVQANGMVDDRLDRRFDDHTRKDYWYVNHKLMQAGPEFHTYADQWGDLRGRTLFPNEPRRAYLNLGEIAPGAFVDVAREIGIADPDNSRGVAMADFDDDGDLDLVVTNQHGAVSIYRNTLRSVGGGGTRGDGTRGGDTSHFLGVQLAGNGSTTHRTAIGTRIEASWTRAGRTHRQVREIGLLGGFSAQGDPRLLFGMGSYDGPVLLEILWYGGDRQTVVLETDRYHVVRQP